MGELLKRAVARSLRAELMPIFGLGKELSLCPTGRVYLAVCSLRGSPPSLFLGTTWLCEEHLLLWKPQGALCASKACCCCQLFGDCSCCLSCRALGSTLRLPVPGGDVLSPFWTQVPAVTPTVPCSLVLGNWGVVGGGLDLFACEREAREGKRAWELCCESGLRGGGPASALRQAEAQKRRSCLGGKEPWL